MNPLSTIQATLVQRRSEQAGFAEPITEDQRTPREQRSDLDRAAAELAAIADHRPRNLTSLQNVEQLALLETAATAIEAAKQAVDTDRALAESTLDTAARS